MLSIVLTKRCTDVLLMVLLLLTWLAMTIVGFAGCGLIQTINIKPGNPYRLTHPLDYQGSLCGFDPSVSSQPYGYYLPDQSLVCVSSCPSTLDITKFVCQYDIQSLVTAKVLLGPAYVASKQCMVYIPTQPGKMTFSVVWLIFIFPSRLTHRHCLRASPILVVACCVLRAAVFTRQYTNTLMRDAHTHSHS
jgi:hypothetical protein